MQYGIVYVLRNHFHIKKPPLHCAAAACDTAYFFFVGVLVGFPALVGVRDFVADGLPSFGVAVRVAVLTVVAVLVRVAVTVLVTLTTGVGENRLGIVRVGELVRVGVGLGQIVGFPPMVKNPPYTAPTSVTLLGRQRGPNTPICMKS